MREKKLKKYFEPWPYIIDEDYIQPEIFDVVKNEIISFIKKQKIKSGITIFDNLTVEETPELENTIKHLNKKDINEDFVKKHFKDHRSFKRLITKNQIIICIGNSEFEIHCDNENKVLSLVTYIHPVKSVGTLIYNKNKEFVKEIQWKPNRTLIFAPQTDVTWHSYKSNENGFRITFNKFLILEE